MSDSRIPKATFYAELRSGTRPNCRLLLRFKDNLKANVVSTGIDPTTWEDLGGNRSKWQKACSIPGCNTLRKPASPMQLRSTADGKVLQVSLSLPPSPQIHDRSHSTTAADNLLQELASSVTRESTGSRMGLELIRRPRRETPSL